MRHLLSAFVSSTFACLALSGCPGSSGSANVSAAEVAYEPDDAGLSATNVQAAVDELASRSNPNDHEARLTSAESTIAALSADLKLATSRLVAAEAGVAKVAALEAKVDVLESSLNAVKAIVATKAAQDTVEAAESALEQLSKKVDPDLISCPTGMVEYNDNGTFCIDSKPREPTSHLAASAFCADDGYSLCRAEQLAGERLDRHHSCKHSAR